LEVPQGPLWGHGKVNGTAPLTCINNKSKANRKKNDKD